MLDLYQENNIYYPLTEYMKLFLSASILTLLVSEEDK